MRWCAPLLLLVVFTFAKAYGANVMVNIDVRQADIADVLTLLAAQSGRNIVPDASIKAQKVTLHLQNVTAEAALTALVQAYDLQVRRRDNVLIIGAASSMNRRFADGGDARGAVTRVLTLTHAVPDDVAKALAANLPDGTVVVPDKRTQSVIVTGNAETIGRAVRLTLALDTPAYPQGTADTRVYALRFLKPADAVTELKVVVADGTFVADDGQNAVVVSGNADVQHRAGAFLSRIDAPSPQVLFEVRVADLQPVNEQSNVGIQFGGYDLNGRPTPGAATYAFTRNSLAINATLNALVSQGSAQILATPKLVTLNNKEADLLIGQSYPVVYYDARLGGQQVQFVDIGVKLRLTPTIGPDGSVTAELHPEYSAIQDFVGGYPVIASRRVDSTLRVKDNQTIVLGGLLRDIDTRTVSKIPGLADLPVFGTIFKNRQTTHQRDEIVFLITPHVIYPGGPVPTH